jgi:hypothetical protein
MSVLLGALLGKHRPCATLERSSLLLEVAMASVPSTPIRAGWQEILHKGKLLGREPSLRQWKWGFRITSITLALLFAWARRFAMNVDGISYLDMAYAYMRADWRMAVNPYWGAGYSWLLGAVLTAFTFPGIGNQR